MSLRYKIAMLLLIALGACNQTAAPAPSAEKLCVALGARLHREPVTVFMFGGRGAKLQLRNCPDSQLGLGFIGTPPPSFEEIRQRAANESSVVILDGLADGYVVSEFQGKRIFLVLSLDALVPNKQIQRDADSVVKGR
jgi:hypothetical protein